MRIIGLTGRSGCGKSTVAEYWRSCGCPVADADFAARKALLNGSGCIQELCREFGSDILEADGSVKRRLLADRAFASPGGSQTLIRITHGEIVRTLLEQAQQAKEQGEPLFVVDGAVIVDAPFEKYCDAIVLVSAPIEQSVSRICARDGISEQAARARLDAQISEEKLRSVSQFEIRNEGSKEQLLADARRVLDQLKGGGKC